VEAFIYSLISEKMKSDKQLFDKLLALHLISPLGLFRIICSLLKEGVNLMAILDFARKYYALRVAANCEGEDISYKQLYDRSKAVAAYLHYVCYVHKGTRVGVLCRNSPELLYVLFGLSSIGTKIYFLNLDMSDGQLKTILGSQKIETCICDDHLEQIFDSELPLPCVLISDIVRALSHACFLHFCVRIFFPFGELVVLTGGTSGHYKTAGRKPSLFRFISPFLSLIECVRIYNYQKVYVAPPIYHGFGLAATIVTFAIGKTLYISNKFSAERGNDIISRNQIDMLIAVPTMLRRMLHEDVDDLKTLKCILSGGAPLDEKLVRDVENNLGQVLYNLYGTSEAGFFVLATPADLNARPLCIGRPIRGVAVQILDKDKHGVGTLYVKSTWAMDGMNRHWQSTGDRACMDDDKIISLRGRTDTMIVSGGENVYPEDVENILLTSQYVEQAAVIPIQSEDFGQGLEAYVVLSHPASEDEISQWLKIKVARYQMPRRIFIVKELPILQTGKIAKQRCNV
jgi:fatty-acyl-CoA synthase